tara:strand:+ start:2958 stop:3401 length:444 start_codon:yes stop_codon:yes gene_type:complete
MPRLQRPESLNKGRPLKQVVKSCWRHLARGNQNTVSDRSSWAGGFNEDNAKVSATPTNQQDRTTLLGDDPCTQQRAVALDQLKAFLVEMQNDEGLKQSVLSASTADDVARIAIGLGFEFSGDELLRFSGQKVGKVTVSKQDHPGEYH